MRRKKIFRCLNFFDFRDLEKRRPECSTRQGKTKGGEVSAAGRKCVYSESSREERRRDQRSSGAARRRSSAAVRRDEEQRRDQESRRAGRDQERGRTLEESRGAESRSSGGRTPPALVRRGRGGAGPAAAAEIRSRGEEQRRPSLVPVSSSVRRLQGLQDLANLAKWTLAG